MKKKLNKREKLVVSCMKPFYGGFSNPKELKAIRKLAAGSYWIDTDWGEYVSFSPRGQRTFFAYSEDSKDKMKKCAALWARGKTTTAINLYKNTTM